MNKTKPIEEVTIPLDPEWTVCRRFACGHMQHACCSEHLDATCPMGCEDPTAQIEIAGEYGTNDGSIHILVDGKEVVMWDSAEWIEDPSVVYVIANAIRLAYQKQLPEALGGPS